MPDASTMDSAAILLRVEEIEVRQEKADQMISDLCHRKRNWTMSIPARPDYDPDLVISASLGDVTFLIKQLRLALADTRRVDYYESIYPSIRKAIDVSMNHSGDVNNMVLLDPDAAMAATTREN